MTNLVYIATSLDGYIADKNGGLQWLESVPNPETDDFGFAEFLESVDALLMGRVTFETVCGFDVKWPYPKPVYVISSTRTRIPDRLSGKAFPVSGPLPEVLKQLKDQGVSRLYVDGGKLIQSCLNEDFIDEMTVFRMPVLLGGGTPLFGPLKEPVMFEHLETKVFLNAIVKSRYLRKR